MAANRTALQRLGRPFGEGQRIERHVALGTQYPLFQNARWTRADALKAGSLLEALTDDQRLEVIPQLAELDPHSALRLLEGLSHPPGGVVPVPTPTSGAASPAADASAQARRGAAPPVPAGTPSASVPRLLGLAKLLVLHAADRLQNRTLCARLQQVAGDLQVILLKQVGAPATAAPVVARIPAASVVRVLEKAKALVLQAAAHPSLNPTLQQPLQRVVDDLEAALVQLQPRADNGRTRS